MNRRGFLETGLGAIAAMSTSSGHVLVLNAANAQTRSRHPALYDDASSPHNVKLNLKPVMTNIIHTGVWEGPCRWSAVSVSSEKERAKERFARWSEQISREASLSACAYALALIAGDPEKYLPRSCCSRKTRSGAVSPGVSSRSF